MNNRYKGGMPDNFFRPLTAKEEEKFRTWTRENWQEKVPDNMPMFHPIVRDEWRKIDLEKGIR